MNVADDDIKKIKKEAEILKKLNHPNIIKYIGVNIRYLYIEFGNSKEHLYNDGKNGRRHISRFN